MVYPAIMALSGLAAARTRWVLQRQARRRHAWDACDSGGCALCACVCARDCRMRAKIAFSEHQSYWQGIVPGALAAMAWLGHCDEWLAPLWQEHGSPRSHGSGKHYPGVDGRDVHCQRTNGGDMHCPGTNDSDRHALDLMTGMMHCPGVDGSAMHCQRLGGSACAALALSCGDEA